MIEYRVLETEVIEGIFKNPNVTPGFVSQVLDLIPAKLPMKFLLGVANCPASDADQLRDVWKKHKTNDFRTNLASNSATPLDILESLFDIAAKGEGYLLGDLLNNPSIPRCRLAPFLVRKSEQRTLIFKATTGNYGPARFLLWEDLACNSSLTEEEQLALVRFIPNPEVMLKNPSCSLATFQYLSSRKHWLRNWYPTHLCSQEQLTEAAESWLANPHDHKFGELAFGDVRCPTELVLRGRGAGSESAWSNEAVAVNWGKMSVDETMPNAIAGRTDLPKDLAHKIAERGIFERADDKYAVYRDSAKWILSESLALDPEVAITLYERGITSVLENPRVPTDLLLNACSDRGLKSYVRAKAVRNSGLTEELLVQFLGLDSD